MRAIRLHDFGPASHLVLDELPDLVPDAGQVRISVAAAGVHLLDTSLRRGEPGPVPPPELPTIPGREVAGVVDLVGADLDPAWVGRRVVAHLGLVPGGYAEQAVTTPEKLFPVPDGVDLAEAVAMVGTGRTAQGILELEPPVAADTVLVPAAAGGLGWLLVQAAKASGARVVAAARGDDKLARLKELEPDLVVDYGLDAWEDEVRRVVGGATLVYDGVGGSAGPDRAGAALPRRPARDVRLLRGRAHAGSTRVTSCPAGSASPGAWARGWSRCPAASPAWPAARFARHAAGEWQPLVTAYPLAEAARAHADLEDRATMGKVVLVP